MTVNGKEVVVMPLKIFGEIAYCPGDFFNEISTCKKCRETGCGKYMYDIFGRKVGAGLCDDNKECEKCWSEAVDMINEIYGVTTTTENSEILRNFKKLQINESDREYALEVLQYETDCLESYKIAFKTAKNDNMKKIYEKCIKKKTLICEALTHYVLGR